MPDITIPIPDNSDIVEAVSEDVEQMRAQLIDLQMQVAEMKGQLEGVAAASLATTGASEVDLSPVLLSLENMQGQIQQLATRIREVEADQDSSLPDPVPPADSHELSMPKPVPQVGDEDEDKKPPPERPFWDVWAEWLFH